MATPLPDPWHCRLLQAAEARAARSRQRSIQPPAGLDFCSNDYLGLRGDPRLARAAASAAEAWGSGTGAARLLRGTTPLHDELETLLAEWKRAETSLLFNTGYQCNATLIPALVGPGDTVFSDALNHASLVDGCRLARQGGASVEVFHHLDLGDLEARLRGWRQSAPAGALALVATDAIFSMDGDAAELPALAALAEQHGALLLVDEAHGTGVMGAQGAGLAEAQGLAGRLPLVMGTLGKALGCFGAFVAGSDLLRTHLVNTCRGFIFSTALPPAAVGAALEALRIARAEPWRREKAAAHARRLREALGLPAQPSAIVPVLVGPDARALELARAIQARGFDVRAVRPPTVPEGTARLRITTGAHLEAENVDALLAVLKELL